MHVIFLRRFTQTVHAISLQTFAIANKKVCLDFSSQNTVFYQDLRKKHENPNFKVQIGGKIEKNLNPSMSYLVSKISGIAHRCTLFVTRNTS